MKPDENLFSGTEFWIASRAPADPLCTFASRFGAENVRALPPAQAGPVAEEFQLFGGKLVTADLDGAVLFSAAGTQQLIEAAGNLSDPGRLLTALADSRILVAGPRAARVLRRKGIEPRETLPEADGWRRLVTVLEQSPDLAQSRLVVESTIHDLALQSALESRGVHVQFIPLVASPLEKTVGRSPAAPQSVIVLLADLEGLAGLLASDCPLHSVQAAESRVFTVDADLQELAVVLGLDARLLTTGRPVAEWSSEEAWQIAAQSW
jgi:Uroporphyrinogen-III synthase HemD